MPILSCKRRAKIYKALQIIKLRYLPFSLGIETGNLCNLKCPLCPTGANDKSMKRGFMDLRLFKKIIDELHKGLEAVNLYSWGEPLLNNDLISMIRYIKDKKKDVNITTSTNLNITDKNLLTELVNSGIGKIIVSCDGASEESYVKYRVGGNFNLVMKNMEFLLSSKRKSKKDINIIWNFLVFKHNEHEIDQAKKTALSLGIKIEFGKMRTNMKDEILKSHSESIYKDLDWIPDNSKYSAYDKNKLSTKKTFKTCRKPWQEITVNWDGKVLPCCAVYGGEFSYGNVKDNSIESIWNNLMYLAARRQIAGKIDKTPTICNICKHNQFMHM